MNEELWMRCLFGGNADLIRFGYLCVELMMSDERSVIKAKVFIEGSLFLLVSTKKLLEEN